MGVSPMGCGQSSATPHSPAGRDRPTVTARPLPLQRGKSRPTMWATIPTAAEAAPGSGLSVSPWREAGDSRQRPVGEDVRLYSGPHGVCGRHMRRYRPRV